MIREVVDLAGLGMGMVCVQRRPHSFGWCMLIVKFPLLLRRDLKHPSA